MRSSRTRGRATLLAGSCLLALTGCEMMDLDPDGDVDSGEVSDVSGDPSEIVNGDQVSEVEYQDLDFMVGISYRPSGGTRTGHSCGGTLIHPRWVLTAAHCFQDGAIMEECRNPSRANQCRATIGVRRLSDARTANLFAVERVVMHPQYDAEAKENDLALVELDRPAPVTPVTLFSEEHADMECWGFTFPAERAQCGLNRGAQFPDRSPPYQNTPLGQEWNAHWLFGDSVLAAGWGKTEDPSFEVSDFLMRTGIGEGGTPGVLEYSGRGAEQCVDESGMTTDGLPVSDNVICARDFDVFGTDSCQGDSGGPLLIRQGQTWQQIGVTSWGIGCGDGGFYTYVPAYRDWIATQIGMARFAGPGALDDTVVSRRIFFPGHSGHVPGPSDPGAEGIGAGKTYHFTTSSRGKTEWTTESETLIAVDTGSSLEGVIVRRARLKLFMPVASGLSAENGETAPAGELCLAPNTSAWDRNGPVEWSEKPDTSSCLPATRFGTTSFEFRNDYAGYARVEGEDLLDYVAFDIPVRSQQEARQWLRNGFTMRSLEDVGFARGFGSSESPFPPELTVVYDCAEGYSSAGGLRCVRQAGRQAMEPFASAASTATTTPGDGVLRIGGSSSDPSRALVLFDKEVIRTEIGTGRLVSARLEVPIDSASGWYGQYLALHRVDAPWTRGPTPLAITPSAVRWTSGAGVAVFDVTGDIDMYLNGLDLGPFGGVQEIENHGWAVKKLFEWMPGTAAVGATQSGAPARLVLDIDR